MSLGCSRRELLGSLTARELAEWMAYEMLEPFGAPAHAFNAGVVASTLGNVNRARDSEPFVPEDFTPQIYRKPKDEAARRERVKKRRLAAKVKAAFGALMG